MHCTDIATIMDEHRDARLTAAERSAVDAHLSVCADCAAAWQAQTELLALRVPPPPPTLLDDVLHATRTHASAAPRRSRAPIIIASALLAGAAVAAVTVTVMNLAERTPTGAEPVPTLTTAPPPSEAAASGEAADDTTTPRDARATSVELVETALNIVPIVRHPPEYPATAIERGLEGSVTLKFDVSTTGAVQNASVVDSTQPELDEAALRALSRWKFLPRIVAGKRVATRDQRTVIRFQLAPNAPANSPAPERTTPRSATTLRPDFPTFAAAVEVAWERFAVEDFRGAELQLDELRALYELEDSQQGNVWDFYAYLYTVQGNYDRAIDAYETAIAAFTRAGGARAVAPSSSLPLANLYYARHQYDMALRTLLAYKAHASAVQTPRGAPRFEDPGIDEFIARLRAIGVTEETLTPRR